MQTRKLDVGLMLGVTVLAALPLAVLAQQKPGNPQSAQPNCDDRCGAMKRILQNRDNGFATIRTNPRRNDVTGETRYDSSVRIPLDGHAAACNISPWRNGYDNSCSLGFTGERRDALSDYHTIEDELRTAMPQGWVVWTRSYDKWPDVNPKPHGEETWIGPDRTHPAAVASWDCLAQCEQYRVTIEFFSTGLELEPKQ